MTVVGDVAAGVIAAAMCCQDSGGQHQRYMYKTRKVRRMEAKKESVSGQETNESEMRLLHPR